MTTKEALRTLNEMADSISAIRSDIRNSQWQRLQNLMQIFLFRDSSTTNHWCDELFGVCHRVSKWKNTNKWPDYNKLYEFLVDPWEDSFYDTLKSEIEAIRIKEEKTRDEMPDFNPVKMHDFIIDYHKWLAKCLSIDGEIESCDILKSTIQDLLCKSDMF